MMFVKIGAFSNWYKNNALLPISGADDRCVEFKRVGHKTVRAGAQLIWTV